MELQRPRTHAWLHPQQALQDGDVAAPAQQFLFIPEFFPAPHLLHSACRKPNFGKSAKSREEHGHKFMEKADLCFSRADGCCGVKPGLGAS